MTYRFWTLILVAVAVAGMGCEQIKPGEKSALNAESNANRVAKASQAAATGHEPPLPLDQKPLLLLDDSRDVSQPGGPVADNSRCYVCHINYIQEDVAVVHARASIGCKDCHGESDAHIADESWSWGGNGTAPDIMYPLAKVNPLCMGCHPRDKIDTEQHKPLFAAGEEKYCTDCHGQHRLARRRCKWK